MSGAVFYDGTSLSAARKVAVSSLGSKGLAR